MEKLENQIQILPQNTPEKNAERASSNSARTLGVPLVGLGASLPNLLLIAGNGRNVGKTTLACKIIQHLSTKDEVFGLKISPHFHEFNESEVIIKNDCYVIIEEKKINTKDSSLMLQAGAKRVYYVMVKPEYLEVAVEQLIQILPNKLIVCESGGLHELVKPGLFLMVNRKGKEIVKTHLLQYDPVIINNDGENFDFEIHRLEYKNQQIKLKN